MEKWLCAAAGILSVVMSVLAQERAANTSPPTKAATDRPTWLKRDTVIAGSRTAAPDGVIYYYLGEQVVEGKKTFHRHLPGIYRSPISEYRPAPIGGTERDYEVAHIDVSDDGGWLLYSCTAAPAAQAQENISGVGRRLVLCRSDGSVRAEAPTGRDGPESLLLSGFYRQSPFGSEIFYSRNNSTILARRVDWTSTPPRFGAERVICSGIAWDGDDSMAVSGSHLHGRLGELSRYVTIPEGGKGTAGPDNLWRFTGKSKFGCAVTLSHDGRLAVSNPTQLDKVDRYPAPGEVFPIWHRGFVVLPFKEDREPSLDIADYYFGEAISANWVFATMRPGNHDFSQWRATNHTEYVIGRQISRPSTYGCWLVHWPTNTWTRLTPPETVLMGPAAHLRKAMSASVAEAPQSRPATAPNGAANASGQALDRLTVRSPAPAASALTVLATLARASTMPTPKSIAPYKQALVFNAYRIDGVLQGQLEHRELLIGHWAVRDGKTVPDAERTEGRSYRMSIEPLDRHPQLRELARYEATTQPSLPVFYDLGDSPASSPAARPAPTTTPAATQPARTLPYEISLWPRRVQGVLSLTFDDGAEKHFTETAVELDKRGLKATFCINSAWIGGKGRMTWEQLRKLAAAGHEIGSHTHSHGYKEGEQALSLCKETIQKEVPDQKVLAIAYPSGGFSPLAAKYHIVAAGRQRGHSSPFAWAGLAMGLAAIPCWAAPAAGPPAATRPAVVERLEPTVIAEVQLLEKSRTPQLKEVVVYREALAVYRYRVLRVIKGSLAADTILVTHWVIRNNILQVASEAGIGQRATLKLRPFADLKGLHEVQQSNTIDDHDSPMFHDVGQNVMTGLTGGGRWNYSVELSDKMPLLFALKDQLKLVILGDCQAAVGNRAELHYADENRVTPVALNLCQERAGLDMHKVLVEDYLVHLPKLEWVLIAWNPRYVNGAWPTHGLKYCQFIRSPGYLYDRSRPENIRRAIQHRPATVEDIQASADLAGRWKQRPWGWHPSAAVTWTDPMGQIRAAQQQKGVYRFSQERWELFRSMLRILTDRKVKVLAFIGPYHPETTKVDVKDKDGVTAPDYQEQIEKMRALERKHDGLFFFYDLNKMGHHGLLAPEDFGDMDHPNGAGATKLSNHLEQYRLKLLKDPKGVSG